MIAPDPRRRALLARVHMAAKALGMDDDDYRHLLQRVTGHTSAGACNVGQLQDVADEFGRLGSGHRPAQRKPAAHPVARRARALWISLHQLGAIEDASERALEAFGKRQLGVDRLQWADQRQGFRLIEALKAIAARHGWDTAVPARLSSADQLRLVKARLVAALIAKLDALGVAPIGVVASARDDWTMGEIDTAIRHLAKQLRAARDARR